MKFASRHGYSGKGIGTVNVKETNPDKASQFND